MLSPTMLGLCPGSFLAPKVKVLLTEKGREMAARLYRFPKERMEVVRDGDSLDLGRKTLRFLDALLRALAGNDVRLPFRGSDPFPCDFFGAHTAKGFYAEGVPNIERPAKSYFGEIMMPCRRAAQRALETTLELKPAMIAPSHGPIWRDHAPILTWYKRWAAGETNPKFLVAYVSMWNATEKLVTAVLEPLPDGGLDVAVHDLAKADLGALCADFVDSQALVFGAPTVLGDLHPLASFALGLVRALEPPIRFGLILSSHGWAGGALHQAQELLASLDIELLGRCSRPARPRGTSRGPEACPRTCEKSLRLRRENAGDQGEAGL